MATPTCAHQWLAIRSATSLRVLCRRCGLAARLDRSRDDRGDWRVRTELLQQNPDRLGIAGAPEFVAFAGDVAAASAAIVGAPAVRHFLAAAANPLPLTGLGREGPP